MGTAKKPVLDWKPDDHPWSEFPGMRVMMQSLHLFTYPLNKMNTRHYDKPVTGEGELWIANVKTSSGHLIGYSGIRHVNVVDAQLEAEGFARKYLSADWAALNPLSFLNELLARGANWLYGTRGRPFERIPGFVTMKLESDESDLFGKMLYEAETLRLSSLVCSCGVGLIVCHSETRVLRYNCTCTNDELADPSEWEVLRDRVKV